MKKSLLLCLAALCCHIGVWAESGTCGTLTWELRDGVLTIEGSGAIPSYTNYPDVPWYSLRESIQIINLPEGLTAIGEYAFRECRKV